MKFVCDRCQTKYSIADEKVRQKILKIRCKTCENVITVREASPEAAAPPAAAAAPAVAAAPAGAAHTAAAASVAPPLPAAARLAPEWHLARDGKEEGPFDLATIARRVQSAAPGDELYVWKADFDGWKLAKDVPAVKAELAKLAARPTSADAGSAKPTGLPVGLGGARASSSMPIANGQGAKSGAFPPLSASAGPGRSAAKAPLSMSALSSQASAATAGDGHGFDEDDRTQISPLDAAMLRFDESAPAPAKSARPTANGTADKSSSPLGRPTNGAIKAVTNGAAAVALPAAAPVAAARAFSPPQPMPVAAAASAQAAAAQPAFFPAPSAPPAVRAPAPSQLSQLSRLVGLPGFFARHPGLKYGALGAVLLTLVVVVVGIALQRKTPEPAEEQAARMTTERPHEATNLDEEKARLEARKRFGAGLAPEPEKVVSVVPRAGRPDPQRRQSDRKPAPVQPKAAPSLAPPPIAKAEPVAPPPVGQVAGPLAVQERRVAPTASRSASERSSSKTGGSFSQDEFMSVVKKNYVTLKSCYERALRRDDRLRTGKLDIQVTVGPLGGVTGVRCEAPAEFSTVSSCIERAVKKMHFPSSGEEYTTSFPLVLHGAG